jgi:hypothetical protein
VRIADADRVRLGAHLAAGTTVMHEGFVNFNAGTLGSAMIEGRISAGVVVGDGSDLGGSRLDHGHPVGRRQEVIRIGERCLLGANAGIGISLGDDCIVEAGLYVTAGTKVTLPDGTVVKAGELSGQSRAAVPPQLGLRCREVAERGDRTDWGGLNAASTRTTDRGHRPPTPAATTCRAPARALRPRCVTGDEGPIADAVAARYTRPRRVGRPRRALGRRRRPPRWRCPLVLLVGHLDVVPPTDDDLDPRVEDGATVSRWSSVAAAPT